MLLPDFMEKGKIEPNQVAPWHRFLRKLMQSSSTKDINTESLAHLPWKINSIKLKMMAVFQIRKKI